MNAQIFDKGQHCNYHLDRLELCVTRLNQSPHLESDKQYISYFRMVPNIILQARFADSAHLLEPNFVQSLRQRNTQHFLVSNKASFPDSDDDMLPPPPPDMPLDMLFSAPS